MWSVGCILVELINGGPLFPALDENELLEFIIAMIGLPPAEMVKKSKNKSKFFDKNGNFIKSP